MFISSRAIVLNKVRYTDQKIIVTLYTESNGSTAFCVRIPTGSRATIKSTLFQPLNLLNIEWEHHPTSSLQRLRAVNTLNPYATLCSRPDKAAISTFLAEMLYYSLKQEHQGELFSFVQNSLLWLDTKEPPYANFHIVFLALLARYLGFEPNLDNASQLPVFDLINGEYVASPPTHPYYIQNEEARFLPTLHRINYTNLHLLRMTRAQRQRALSLMVTYYRLHVPSFPAIKSLQILSEVFD